MKKRRSPKKKKSIFAKHKIGTALTGLFIISIMALSALNMWNAEESGKVEYKGIEFARTDAGFIAYKGTQRIFIKNNPSELENMSIPTASPGNLVGSSKIYLSYDHLAGTRSAVRTFLQNYHYDSLLVEACPEDNELCRDLPLRDCSDAGDGVGVILFQQSNVSKVFYQNENCLIIQGKELDKVVEKMVLEDLL